MLLKSLLLFVCVQLNVCFPSLEATESPIVTEVLQGREVIPYLQRLAELRISFFQHYPYLYEGNLMDEENYLNMYVYSENSVLVVAKNEGEVVGCVSGIPLVESPEENRGLYAREEVPAEHIFYLGEIVLLEEYQRSAIQQRLYEQFEKAITALQRYHTIAVCEIERGPEDSKKPVSAVSSEVFWGDRGFIRQPELNTSYAWKEIGELEIREHRMVFWHKKIPYSGTNEELIPESE